MNLTKESSVEEFLEFFRELAEKEGESLSTFFRRSEICYGVDYPTELGDVEFMYAEEFFDQRYAQVVFKFLGRFFQIHYVHSSWGDSEVDTSDFDEVFPEEITTTIYKKKKNLSK